EVEQPIGGEVEILEDEDERPVLGERLEKAAAGGKCLAAVAAGVGPALEAYQRPKMALDPRSVTIIYDERAHGTVELRRGLLLRVRLQDAGLPLHDLSERPENNTFAVRERPALAPGHKLRPPFDVEDQLPHEASLPDPNATHDLRTTRTDI